ncbi:MAG: efflux RND transporter periplasmic adaptor subunit, partial [Bdellovibrionales bacterium]
MRYFWYFGLPFLLIVVLALGIRQYRARGYEWIHPRRGELTEAVYGLGKVKSNQKFEVKLGVISTVKHLYVKEGARVKKGDRLVQFDTNALFTAPFSGTVTWIVSYEGETVVPQATLLRMENLEDRYVEVSLEQEAAIRVKAGQKAKVSFESLRGQVLEGQVIALFPRQDEFIAQVSAPQLGPEVLPGMTADVSIEIGKIEGALLVPLKAIAGGMITIKKNGKRSKKKIEIGHVDGLWA